MAASWLGSVNVSVGVGIAAIIAAMPTSVSVAAEELNADTSTLAVVQFGDTSYFIQVLFSLLLVLGAIFLLSFLIRKFELNPTARKGPIRVLHSIGIGGKEQLILVEVGKEQVLISRTPGNVQALHHLAEPIAVATDSAAESGMNNVFAKVLNRELQ